ncbi:DnaJ domain-containing protein [Natronoarchaeum philippinense]|uniref:DnaJ domain-containing protein n=1 Tax=Natronoarchaeum philippinense TaxID=558529 RepID=A0A285N654_NATPI|nr:DnaJ domain-containing protein [Natronoarchaeum philippinense]SNZ04964.1 DnaJ domain-containing protein [Natronoarchaeum philippinense]
MTDTFYDVLGVPETADQDEIQSAYREKVKKYHPDVSDRDDAAERFKAVTRAEEVLGDATERARYDRLGHDAYVRHLDGANAGTSEQSPWTNTGGDGSSASTGDAGGSAFGGSASASGTSASGTSASARERARAATGAEDGGGASQHRKQRRRRRANKRRADSSWTPEDADTQREDSEASSAESDGGYTVHDWEPVGTSFIGERPGLTRNEFVQITILGLLYPVLLYSAVTPAFPLAVNGVVAALTLLLIGYLITRPLVAGTVFGVWSMFAPVAIVQLGVELLSVPAMTVILGCWIPLGYSITVAFVLRW